MQKAKAQARRGFSLLEMVLALAIGMLLLLALYFAFETYVSQAQTGRDIVAESALVRNVMTRIANDAAGQLGPKDVRVADYVDTTQSDTPTNFTEFNGGVYGKDSYFILSGYRVRPQPTDRPPDQEDAKKFSDMTRTIYWIAMNGNDPAGLARHEIRQATSKDIDLDPTALPGEQKDYIIAPEVKSMKIRYFDGSQWATEWDGLFKPFDGAPPVGPPGALEITLTLKRSLKGGVPDTSGQDGPTFTQIVALPASNNFPAPTTTP